MPAALRDLLATVTDAYTVVAVHSRPDDLRPPVWEIEGPDSKRWFAKQHVGDRLHQREVNAYQQWTRALGTDRAPFLAASNSKGRVVVVTAIPGSSLDKLRLPAEQEREAYRQAGLLLARQHTADPGQPPTAAAEADWDEKLTNLLDGAARYVTADEIAMLHSLAKQAPAVLPKVVAHGDYRDLH
ncbi:phosphotransferase [Streptomyces sp. NPDC018833]|uniref:phosphotransferase n=1 Tax=Streptomyces sp. NPDC018833 TaxID=3365053 RepID=UPI00379CFCD5